MNSNLLLIIKTPGIKNKKNNSCFYNLVLAINCIFNVDLIKFFIKLFLPVIT